MKNAKKSLLVAGTVFAAMCISTTDVSADDIRIGRILTILEKMDSRFGKLEGRVGRLEGGGFGGSYAPSQPVEPIRHGGYGGGYGGGFVPYGGGGSGIQTVGFSQGGSFGMPRVMPVDAGTGRPAYLIMLKHRR